MKKLISFVILLLLGEFTFAQKLYVVSVGVCNYRDPAIRDLRYTEADVMSFNRVMQTHTQEVYSLVGSNATHARVYNTIRQVFAKATANDIVYFFFSGHGYPGGFCCYDMSRSGGALSYNEIAALFRGCMAKRKIVFADACFSGGLRKESRGNASINVVRNSDVMFFLSSRTNEMSQEMRGGPNGQFTRFLVRGLTGGADQNADRVITARELYEFVHEGVARATANRQHPVMWGRFDNNMSVFNWNPKR